jgi:hypothetical protein
MGQYLRQFASSLQDPNQSTADSDAVQADQTDLNANQPDQSVDPSAGPNQSIDPNAGPNQSIDPNAGPNQSFDPNAGPNQSVDPNAGQPNQSAVDPGIQNSVDPSALPATGSGGNVPGQGVFTFEFPDEDFFKFAPDSKLRGGLKLKGEIKFELADKTGSSLGGTDTTLGTLSIPAGGTAGTDDVGVKIEPTLRQTVDVELLSSIHLVEVKESIAFKLSEKKVDLSISVTAKLASTSYPFLSGPLTIKGTVLGLEWAKVAKNPDDYTLTALVFEGGLQGQGLCSIGDTNLKLTTKTVLSGAIGPNWPVIIADGAKQGIKAAAEDGVVAAGEGGGTAAGTAGTDAAAGAVGTDAAGAAAGIDATGAVAGTDVAAAAAGTAAAPVALITIGAVVGGLTLTAGVCAAIGGEEDLGKDAADVCTEGQRQLRDYARSYGSAMRGQPGTNAQGNQDAEARLQEIMSVGKMSHDEAVDAARQSGINYEDQAYRALLPKMRDDIKKAYRAKEGFWGTFFSGNVLEQVMNAVLPADGGY